MYPRMCDKNTNSQRVVSLNVGGQLFTTSFATLKKDPDSTLSQMFSGAGLGTMAVDEAGRFFIDRDPKVVHCRSFHLSRMWPAPCLRGQVNIH